MNITPLKHAGETLSYSERVQLARAALKQLNAAGWQRAEEINPYELAEDPAATIGMALIAKSTSRNFLAAALPLAGAAVGAVGSFFGRKKAEAEARKAEAEARKAEAERARFMPLPSSTGGGINIMIIVALIAGAIILFLLLRR